MLNFIKTGYDNIPTYIRDLEYKYDKNNNLTYRRDNKLDVTHDFGYDDNADITTKGILNTILYQYDDVGNITYKSDVGTYNYDSIRSHVVTSVTGLLNKPFIYDANGNMTKNHNTTIICSSSNKPISLSKTGNTSTFKYDMNDERFEKNTNTSTTDYKGKTYEHTKNLDNSIEHKYYIYANNQVVAIASSVNSNNLDQNNTLYLHYDQ